MRNFPIPDLVTVTPTRSFVAAGAEKVSSIIIDKEGCFVQLPHHLQANLLSNGKPQMVGQSRFPSTPAFPLLLFSLSMTALFLSSIPSRMIMIAHAISALCRSCPGVSTKPCITTATSAAPNNPKKTITLARHLFALTKIPSPIVRFFSAISSAFSDGTSRDFDHIHQLDFQIRSLSITSSGSL